MFVLIYHHGFPIKALCICILCMIKQIIKSRGKGLSVRCLRMIGCTPAVSYLNTCFISSHKPVTTIYFPWVFFFPL